MKLCFVDYPKCVAIEEYNKSIQRMVEKIKNYNGIVSIYQIGSVSTLGISDIDFIVIFEDKHICNANPLEQLTGIDRYLFLHNLFGVSRTQYIETKLFNYFHNYRLIWGKDIEIPKNILTDNDESEIKYQIAMEYLLKMYISLTIQLNYCIVKLRSFLLEVKAIAYDLEFMNTKTGLLYDTVNDVVELRNTWFKNKVSCNDISILIADFYNNLEKVLIWHLENKEFYLPGWVRPDISGHIKIGYSGKLSYIHRGWIFPPIISKLWGKYFNLQNRFNTFEFHFPYKFPPQTGIISKRFTCLKAMKEYNEKYLFYFSPLMSSLNII